MALPNLTNIAKKPDPKKDALAQMMDRGVIAQAGQPQAQKPPTLGTATGVAPSIKPMGFGGGPQQPQMQRPMNPTNPVGPKTVQAGGAVQTPEMPMRPTRPPNSGGVPGAPTGGLPPAGAQSGLDIGATPSTPPQQPASASQDDIDAMIRKFVEGQLANAGNVDTSAQEALIRDQMEGKLGASLVDQRARMGRAGFGAGGVTAALESDARTNASREALDQILGFRTSENQRSVDNARNAISTEQGVRSAASDDALRLMILETLQAEAGLEGDGSGVPAYGTPTGVGGSVAAGTDAQREAASAEYLTRQGYDLNGDGELSDSERQKSTADKMAAIQKFKDTTDKSSIPTVAPGGDWVVLFAPSSDPDKPHRGMSYNKQTGEIGYYD